MHLVPDRASPPLLQDWVLGLSEGWRSTRMRSGTVFGQRGKAWQPEGLLEQKFWFFLSLRDAGRQGQSLQGWLQYKKVLLKSSGSHK